MRFLFFLLIFVQCQPKENKAQSPILPYFRAHNELRCLLLEANSEHTLFLEITPRRPAAKQWELTGQHLIKNGNEIVLHSVAGNWRLERGNLDLKLYNMQGAAVGRLDLEMGSAGWSGNYTLDKKRSPIQFRWLGYTNNDSLAFFKNAVQAIAPQLQKKIGESPADSMFWAYAPYYYQYNKHGYDVELYQLPDAFPPTIFALERLPKQAYFSVYKYENAAWNRCSDSLCLPDIDSQYAQRSDVLRFFEARRPFLLMRYFGIMEQDGKLRFWKLGF